MTRNENLEDSLEEEVARAVRSTVEKIQELEEEDLFSAYPGISEDMHLHEIVSDVLEGMTELEVRSAWFYHSADLVDATKRAGNTKNAFENGGMDAIFDYLYQAAAKAYIESVKDLIANI